MFSAGEKLQTTAQETQYLTHESHKLHLLQERPGMTREEATREVVNRYAKAEAAAFIHETTVMPEHEAERIVLNLKPEAHDHKIEELFGIMLEKGIKNTLDIVAKMSDPHLEDDFHRFLAQYLHTIGAIPGLKEQSRLERELNHSLFTVTLPPLVVGTDEAAAFKRFIQAMKQLYTGMLPISDWNNDQYYTLELAVQNSGRDITVYASVPREHEDTFEKLVHAYYPGASIEEATNDYNIFSTDRSAIVAATAKLAEPAIFPLSTDDSFEHDPLAALITALSKLEHDGEGAAIQIVISSDIVLSNKTYQSVIDAAEKSGENVKDLFEDATMSVAKGFGKGLLSMFSSEKKSTEPEKEKKLDARGIELAKKKNQHQSLTAGIRILASAATLPRAQSVLSTIKSSFNQFSLVGSNSIDWNDVKTARLHEFVHDFSFRSIHKEEQLPLTVAELATLFHFPVGLSPAPELKESTAATASAPRSAGQLLSQQTHDGVYLGTNVHRGETNDVYLAKEDRVRHLYVIGQTGTGKTTILKNLAIQDIQAGRGVCFIDPHGSDLQDVLANIPPERLDDVIYFDPAYTERPMGLNMLEYDPNFPEQKTFVINELLAIFNKLFDMKVAGGPMFEQYFRNAAGLVMDDPASHATLLEIGRVFTDKAFRDEKVLHCKNPMVRQFWQSAEKTSGEQSLSNMAAYITSKFDVFVSNDIMRPVIAQKQSVFNFREIMDNKKILLVNLSKGRLGDINSSLIGLILVGKLTMAALSRVDILGKQALNDFYLYIDEFQNVTTDSIATILSEARKYRLALIVAHQYVEQLQESIKTAVFGNVGNMIVYRVSPENAELFEKQFAPTFTAADIARLQNFNAYARILVNGVPEKPFNLRASPPPRGNAEITEKVKELSYLKYGRPRAEIESDILSRYA